MQKNIEDIYYGRLSVSEQTYPKGSQYDETLSEVVKLAQDLQKLLLIQKVFCNQRDNSIFHTLPPDLFNTSQAINQRGFTAALKQNCRNHRAQENQCNHNQQSGKHRISAQGIAHL